MIPGMTATAACEHHPSNKPEDSSGDWEAPEAPFAAFAPVPRPWLNHSPVVLERDLHPSHVAAALGERRFVSTAGSLAFVFSFRILDVSAEHKHVERLSEPVLASIY